MTLSTNLYVLDEVNPQELFRFCQGLLTEYDDSDEPQPPEQQVWYDKPLHEIWNQPGVWNIANRIGQGLPAILDIRYRPGAPLATAEQAVESRACWLHIDFDTTYGYRDKRGWNCGALHAVLVARVGEWCDERGVRWEWQNEYTGEIWGGDDRYVRLADLCKGSDAAVNWFDTMVRPAIERGLIG